MSEKLQIIVESKDNFFQILENMEGIADKDFNLIDFKDTMHRAIHGCSCKRKENLAKANEIYDNLNKKISAEALSFLKEKLNAEKIHFFKDKNILLFSL